MTGLFGGTFDPPHLGHVELARHAHEYFELDRLRILVAAEPGHKPVECPAEERLWLAQLAFADLPRTQIEIDRHAYTIDFLRDERPSEAIFLVGADEYRDFESWKEPEAVLALVKLAVATRFGVDPPPVPPEHEARVIFFGITSPPISSREIRARAARGEPIDKLVPPAVAREITAKRLYRD